MEFARFMSSAAGRLIRIVAGAALVIVGVFVMGNVLGFVLAVVGLVPLLAGITNVCVFAPLFGGPFLAKNIS
jgi:hypothetical protein